MREVPGSNPGRARYFLEQFHLLNVVWIHLFLEANLGSVDYPLSVDPRVMISGSASEANV